MRRIFIDYTQTFTCDMNTGIQRVVKKLISNTQQLSSAYDIESVSVCCAYGYYFNIPKQSRTVLTTFTMKLKAFYKNVKSYFKKHPRLSFCVNVVFPRIIRSCLIRTFYQICNTSYLLKCKSQRIRFQGGDILVLIEAGWICPNYRAIRRAKAAGAIVVQMIHDLIPWHYPEFVGQESHALFSEWIVKTAEYADLYICNSNHTKNELEAFLKSIEISRDKSISVEHFKLGCDIQGKNFKIESEVSPFVRGLFSTGETKEGYVCVGTLEKRKNQEYLLDAFENVWTKAPQAKLFLVGRCNGSSLDLKKRIEKHPLFKKNLFWLQGLNDDDLQFVLRHAKAMVLPTLAEGFGLPIVEALSQRVPVLANNLPALRETGDGFCSFFDSCQPDTLAKLVLDIELCDKWPPTREIDCFRGTTWEESSKEFLDKILKHFG